MEGSESTIIYDKLIESLDKKQVSYQMLSHEAVFTSEDSARVRGVSLHSGSKALIIKADDKFIMIILPANFSLDSTATRAELHCKKLRFATKEEVFNMTGLQPGSIPPFGSLFKLPTYCDIGLSDNDTIYFNAGMHTRSLGLKYATYIQYENPILGKFGEIK